MRRQRAVFVCAGLSLGFLAACADGGQSQMPSAPSTSSPTPATASPAVVTPTPGLAPIASFSLERAVISLGEVDPQLKASTGSISLSVNANGEQQVSVRGTRRNGRLLWTLDLTITQLGRASGGTLVSDGRSWNVTAGTGSIRIERSASTFSLLTTHAVTTTETNTSSVNTPMVITLAV